MTSILDPMTSTLDSMRILETFTPSPAHLKAVAKSNAGTPIVAKVWRHAVFIENPRWPERVTPGSLLRVGSGISRRELTWVVGNYPWLEYVHVVEFHHPGFVLLRSNYPFY